MNAFDHATNIVRLETDGVRHNFVVSLADEHWRLVLSMGRSAQRADYIALLARQIIAREIVNVLRNEDCRIAAAVDEWYLGGRLQQPSRVSELLFPSQISELCRQMAELHVVDSELKI